MHVIALGGEPATGKSTVTRRLLDQYISYTEFDWGTLKGLLYDQQQLAVFGKYEREMGGTDTLAMNVITDTKDFLDQASTDSPYEDWTVFFEGDRLYNGAFLDWLDEHDDIELSAYMLDVPKAELDVRHETRNDGQDQSWLDGRRSKYANIRSQYGMKPWFHVKPHETQDEMDVMLDVLQDEIEHGPAHERIT